MDEQRLERLLRAGPPFATPYVARPLVLPEPAAPAPVWGARRLALLLAIVALLLAASVVGALLSGIFRESVVAVVIRPAGACTGPAGLCPDTMSLRYGDGREEMVFPPSGAGPFEIPPDASWSADGRQVAFFTRALAENASDLTDAEWQLWVLDADGGDLRLLQDVDEEPCWAPVWAPDGHALACIALASDADGNILRTTLRTFDVATGSSTELASLIPPGNSAYLYRWSPDSQWLLYLAGGVYFDEYYQGYELWVVRRDGTGRRQLLTPQEMPRRDSDTQVTMADFQWSPGSDAVAFGDSHRIGIVRLDGGQSDIIDPPWPAPPVGTTWSAFHGGFPTVLAWPQPDEIVYGADHGDWKFVATTSLESDSGAVILDWTTELAAWTQMWASPDGRSLHWWRVPSPTGDEQCLMVMGRDDRRARTDLCVTRDMNQPFQLEVNGQDNLFGYW